MRVRPLTRGEAQTLAVWAAAAALYTVVGVFFTDFMLSVFACMGYLLIVVWLLPAGIERLR